MNDNDAAVMLGSMCLAMSADGTISPREREALNLLCLTVPELRAANLEQLLPGAVAAVQQGGSAPEWVRKKAYVLGLEVMIRGNGGKFEAGDANLKGVTALRHLLKLDEDFAAAALLPLRCKYVEGDIDDEMALTIAAAMMAVATADGAIAPSELTAVRQVLRLVSQFEARDIGALLVKAMAIASDLSKVTARFSSLPRFRDKTFTLASEVAHAGGHGAKAQAALAAIEKAMPISEGLAAKAHALFSARYGSQATGTLAGSTWAGKLIAPDGVRFIEFKLTFTTVDAGKVTATMDWGAAHGGAQPVIGTIDGTSVELVDTDGDKKVLTVAGDRITGTDKGGSARIEATRLKGDPLAAAELAGFFACHGILSVEGGGPLIPLVGEEAAGAGRKLQRFAGNDVGACARLAQEHFEANPGNAERAVVVVDGFVNIGGVKKDALLVTFADHASRARVQMAVPYRPKSATAAFAVHKPKILAVEGADAGAVSQAFYRGVDKHTEGAAFWNKHLDQSF